jgi:eukaryotic-like serine/threonine-protein kinase
VISQSPSAGSEVESGSTVAIVVSSGEEVASVPNVIGQLRREAVEAVRAEGLAPFVEEEETEVPSQVGRVVDQFPPPGKELRPGSEVTVVVGKRALEPVEEEEAEPEEVEP